MKLYLSEITDTVKEKKIEDVPAGESFNYGATIKKSDVTATFYRAGETVSLLLKGGFEFETQCARCAADIAVETDASEEFYLFPEDKGDGVDYHYSGDHIDLAPFLNEFFVMNIPDPVFCDENCKGVCSICGIDLNDHDCNCESKISQVLEED